MKNLEFVSTNQQAEQSTQPVAPLNSDQIAEMLSAVRSLYGSKLPPEMAATMLATSPHLAIHRNYQFEPSKERLLELGFSSEVAEVQPLLLASILGGKQWGVELPFSGVDPNLTPLSLLPAGLPPCIDWHLGFQDLFEVDKALVLTDRVSVADLFSTRGYAAMTLLGAERWHSEGAIGPEMREGLQHMAGQHIHFAFSCDLDSANYVRKVMDDLSEELGSHTGLCSFYKMQRPLMPDGTRQDYYEFFLRGGTVDQLVNRSVHLL